MAKGSNKVQKAIKQVKNTLLNTASGTQWSSSIASKGSRRLDKLREREKNHVKSKIKSQIHEYNARRNKDWEKIGASNALPTVTAEGHTYMNKQDVTDGSTSRKVQKNLDNLQKRIEKKEKQKQAKEDGKEHNILETEKQAMLGDIVDATSGSVRFKKIYDMAMEDVAKALKYLDIFGRVINGILESRSDAYFENGPQKNGFKKKRQMRQVIKKERLPWSEQKAFFDIDLLAVCLYYYGECMSLLVPGYHIHENTLQLLKDHHDTAKTKKQNKKREHGHKGQTEKETKKNITLKQTTVAAYSFEKQVLAEYETFVGVVSLLPLQKAIPKVVASAAASVLKQNPTFNFTERLMEVLIKLLNTQKESVGDICIGVLLSCVKLDNNLMFSEKLVNKAYALSKQNGKRGVDRRIMVLFAKLGLKRKIERAEAEFLRRGLIGDRAKSVNKEVIKEQQRQSTYGDMETLMKRQGNIIEKVLMLSLRVLANCENFPPETVVAVLQNLTANATLINPEITKELLDEIEEIVQSDREITIAVAGLYACSVLARSNGTVDVDGHGGVEVDMTWILDALVKCMNKSMIELLTPKKDSSCTSIDNLISLIKTIISDNKVVGPVLANGNSLIELLKNLNVLMLHAERDEDYKAILKIKDDVIQKCPKLKELYTLEGLKLGSSFQETTSLFWTKQAQLLRCRHK